MPMLLSPGDEVLDRHAMTVCRRQQTPAAPAGFVFACGQVLAHQVVELRPCPSSSETARCGQRVR